MCRIYFEKARERAHYNLDQLFLAFIKEPLYVSSHSHFSSLSPPLLLSGIYLCIMMTYIEFRFSTLNEVLADWASHTDPFAELKSDQEYSFILFLPILIPTPSFFSLSPLPSIPLLLLAHYVHRKAIQLEASLAEELQGIEQLM